MLRNRHSDRFPALVRVTLLAIGLLAAAGSAGAQDPVRDPDLMGVWRLVELINYTAEGEAAYPMGDTPSGLFVYTPAGQLSLHIQANPPPPPLEGRSDDAGLLAAARAYIGYFGSWEADPETGVLIHTIDGALIPNRIGQRGVRNYSITGERLVIMIDSDDGRRFLRRLERVE